ncbi:hypothetical protein [Nonomuraea sp. JJY05]|uniref:hypothetical protein n=1 Tax=Nonomuraea sp. JJY05 TaxID=3350255 RepID=UPI00373EF2DF
MQRFASELRKLRQETGGLTYRAMAKRARYIVSEVEDEPGALPLMSPALLQTWRPAAAEF